MINHNDDFENQEMKIQCEFGDAIRNFQISKLLKLKQLGKLVSFSKPGNIL